MENQTQNISMDVATINSSIEENPFLSKLGYKIDWNQKQSEIYVDWINEQISVPTELIDDTCIDDENINKLWTEILESEFNYTPLLKMGEKARKMIILVKCSVAAAYRNKCTERIIKTLDKKINKIAVSFANGNRDYMELSTKKKITKLLLTINPVWLHAILENLFDECITISSYTDSILIVQFMMKRILSDPVYEKNYFNPMIERSELKTYDQLVKKHSLRYCLILFFILDKSTSQSFIQPKFPIFKRTGTIKSTDTFLKRFCALFLFSDKNIIDNIKKFGYELTYKEESVDEYNFRTENISEDLKDGIKLGRLAEYLTGEFRLLRDFHIPAISSEEKMHNVSAALATLEFVGCKVDQISSDAIVEGNIRLTLALLWEIKSCKKSKMNLEGTRVYGQSETIHQTKSYYRLQQESFRYRVRNIAAQNIQRWYRTILQTRKKQQEEEMKISSIPEKYVFDDFYWAQLKIVATVKTLNMTNQHKTIIDCLHVLDVVTKESSRLSVVLAECGALKVIFHIIESSNQSDPCLEALSLCLKTLLNMQNWEESESSVWMCLTENCNLSSSYVVQVLTSTISKYRNHPQIFNKCCDILWRFVQDPEKVSLIVGQSVACKYLKYLYKYVGGGSVKYRQKNKFERRSSTAPKFYVEKIIQYKAIISILGIK